mgnify:CR=1 FL=1|tara:strand:+ start:563 stop:2374 length:1812 start_codon:yes stop_codon:yes gene_type:complete
MASKKILIQVDIATQSAEVNINKVVEGLKKVEGATTKVTKATEKGRAQAGLNNAILLETGRLASDASFGFQGMANNLGQLATLFGSFVKTNKSVTKSIRQLVNSLLGTGGFLIAVQLIIAFGDKIFAFFSKLISGVDATKEAFKNLGDEASKTSAAFDIYISKLQDTNTSQEEQEAVIERLNKEFPEFVKNLQDSGISMQDIRDKTKDANLQIRIQREELIKLAKSRAAMNRIEELSGEIIDETIKGNEIARKKGFEDLESAAKRLAELDAIDSKRRTKEERVERGRLLSIGNNIRNIQKRIQERKNEIAVLQEFVTFSKELTREEDKENKITNTRIENFSSEISAIIRLGKIQSDFAKKRADINSKEIKQEKLSFDERRTNLESQFLQGQLSIDLQEQQSLKELNQLEISEDLKGQARLNIEKYYEDLRTKSFKENSEARKKIDNAEKAARLKTLNDISSMIMSASDIAGRATGAGKALAIAGTLVSTYSSAQKAYESQLTLTPDSPIRAVIAAAAAVAQGLANVAAIRKIRTPAGGQGSQSGTDTTIAAPDFNVVGASETSQLATSLAGVTGRPIQAFVVGKEVTTQQELDRNITNNASIN